MLSARVDLKLAHDACERLLIRWVEPLAALAGLLGRRRSDRALLERAWHQLLLCQPHDDICGCSIDAVHDDDHNRLARVRQIGDELRRRAAEWIAAQTPASEAPLLFNPHPYAARTFLPEQQRIVELPPLGFARLERATRAKEAETSLVEVVRSDGGGVILDNGLLRLRVAPDGRIALRDRRGAATFPNLLQLVDDGDAGDTYDFSPPAQQLALHVPGAGAAPPAIGIRTWGALAAEVTLRYRLNLPAGLTADRRARRRARRRQPLTLRLRLVSGSPLLELELELDNRVDDHRLRLQLSVPGAQRALAGGPFELRTLSLAAPASRPDWWQTPPATEPFAEVAALVTGAGGVALFAPGLRECEARRMRGGGALLITLLRSVRWLARDDLRTRRDLAGPMWPVEGARQLGRHRYRLGVLPFFGDPLDAGLQRHARVHADPPMPLVESHPAPRHAPLPPTLTALGVAPASVVVEAIRPAPAGGVDIRLVNSTRHRVKATITSRWAGASGPPSRPGGGSDPSKRPSTHAIWLGPAEIRTLRLRRPPKARYNKRT